jgi:hypothetical protein
MVETELDTNKKNIEVVDGGKPTHITKGRHNSIEKSIEKK